MYITIGKKITQSALQLASLRNMKTLVNTELKHMQMNITSTVNINSIHDRCITTWLNQWTIYLFTWNSYNSTQPRMTYLQWLTF